MTPTSSYDVHSVERGPHWVAWITRGGATRPERSVLVVGKTQGEAEEGARKWAESQP